MAFKLVVLCAALACVNAGGLVGVAPVAHYSPAAAVSSAYINTVAAPVHAPVAAYAAAPVATYAHAAPVATYAHAAPVATYAHGPAVGITSQNVVRSLGGNAAVSQYSKAVDTAFSSVRKYDTRITNDGLSYAHAPYAATYAAPVATYAKTIAAPVATYAHAAPVATYAHAAPVATYAHAAPVATYAHAPVATYAHAPVATYAKAIAAPVVAKAAIAYSPAVAVSHMSFDGLHAHYAW